VLSPLGCWHGNWSVRWDKCTREDVSLVAWNKACGMDWRQVCRRVITASDCDKSESMRLVTSVGRWAINNHTRRPWVGRLNQSDSLTNRRKPVMTFHMPSYSILNIPNVNRRLRYLPKSSAGFHHSFMAGGLRLTYETGR
jgi:hypothetical protein